MSEWTDDDGRPLGAWVEVDREEWRTLMVSAGGCEALSVFSSLTDPEGTYGTPQIYTAWGYRGDEAPLADIRDYKDDDGRTERQVFRKFVRRQPVSPTDREANDAEDSPRLSFEDLAREGGLADD